MVMRIEGHELLTVTAQVDQVLEASGCMAWLDVLSVSIVGGDPGTDDVTGCRHPEFQCMREVGDRCLLPKVER